MPLLPIPGEKAGDVTTFDFAFFANGCVMPLESQALGIRLNSDKSFSLKPRAMKSHF
jgi:hypothetical protein